MIAKFIKQLFCKHDYRLAHDIKSQRNYVVWRVWCAKCGKWTNKKYH